jgi:hypothetical protein
MVIRVATRAQVGPAPAGSAARGVGRRRGGAHRAGGSGRGRPATGPGRTRRPRVGRPRRPAVPHAPLRSAVPDVAARIRNRGAGGVGRAAGRTGRGRTGVPLYEQAGPRPAGPSGRACSGRDERQPGAACGTVCFHSMHRWPPPAARDRRRDRILVEARRMNGPIRRALPGMRRAAQRDR